MGRPSSVGTDTEAQLVALAQSGDRNAFGELVRVHAQSVMNVIYRMCGDVQVAEEAAQEAFIQAWLHIGAFRPQTSFRNWLYRIGVNAAIDMLRREKYIHPSAIEELSLTDRQPDPEARLSQTERTALIQNAILLLPEASRIVLVLREYEELSYHEIANTLDIPIGPVMSRLNYARKILKERLESKLFVHAEVDHV
jgi:RNA polymerase sigma-70 factor (ECF subfamily)